MDSVGLLFSDKKFLFQNNIYKAPKAVKETLVQQDTA